MVYYIRNQPQNLPPRDYRPYCRECGKKITDFAIEARTGLKFRREVHVELTLTEELLLGLAYVLLRENPKLTQYQLIEDGIKDVDGIQKHLFRSQAEDAYYSLVITKKNL